MLRDLLPQVQRYRDSLSQVQLSGILRDKQKAWDDNIAKLRAIFADYERAASPIDSVKLLDAAERLHAQYEALVRVIRPALKEIDAFHQVLYMLYHHYWPERNQEKVASSLPALKEKMTALNAVVLPERWKKKEAAFAEARLKLSRSAALSFFLTLPSKPLPLTLVQNSCIGYEVEHPAGWPETRIFEGGSIAAAGPEETRILARGN